MVGCANDQVMKIIFEFGLPSPHTSPTYVVMNTYQEQEHFARKTRKITSDFGSAPARQVLN